MLYPAAVVVLHFLDTTKEKSPFSFLPHCDDASAVTTLAGILINTFLYQVKLHCLLELQIFLRAQVAEDKMEHKKRQRFLDQLFIAFDEPFRKWFHELTLRTTKTTTCARA